MVIIAPYLVLILEHMCMHDWKHYKHIQSGTLFYEIVWGFSIMILPTTKQLLSSSKSHGYCALVASPRDHPYVILRIERINHSPVFKFRWDFHPKWIKFLAVTFGTQREGLSFLGRNESLNSNDWTWTGNDLAGGSCSHRPFVSWSGEM